MKFLIVIPTYNERENILLLVKKIFEISKEQLDILVIDDGSPDGTALLIKDEMKVNKRLYLLERSGKQGLGTAYIVGFKWALQKEYDWVIQMDADFSHSPRHLTEFFNVAKSGTVDFIVGSRNISGGKTINWPLSRILISRFGSIYASTVLSCPIKDLTGGFNAWSRKVLDSLDLNNFIFTGFSFQIEAKYRTFKKGFEFKELPIVFEDRKFGKSKMSGKIFWEAFFGIFRLKSIKN